MVEISYRGIQTVSCIQTLPTPNDINNDSSLSSSADGDDPIIHFSPLIVTDLHFPFTLRPDDPSLISLQTTDRIGLRSVEFHDFGIAKQVQFQLISSVIYESMDYTQIVTQYLLENKINGIELMKDDFYVHHKCVWKGQIVAIPILKDTPDQKQCTSLRGKAALKRFHSTKRLVSSRNGNDFDAKRHGIKHWIYLQIVDIITNDGDDDGNGNVRDHSHHTNSSVSNGYGSNNTRNRNKDHRYYRILPAVTRFVQIEHDGHLEQPRLCEYHSSMLLDPLQALNGNNVFYHYRIPTFYEEMIERVLFPNVHHRYHCHSAFAKTVERLKVNPSWLVIASRGHRLRAHLENMATVLGVNYVYKDCVDILGPDMSSTVQHLQTLLQSALQFSPLLLHLDSLHLFEFEATVHSFYNTTGKIKPVLPTVHVFREFMARCAKNHKVILFGSATEISKITREMRGLFTFEHVIESVIDDDGHCDTEIIPKALAPHLSALNLINGLNTSQLFEVIHSVPTSPSTQSERGDDKVVLEGYQDAIDQIRRRQSMYNMNLNLNVSSIPSVKWADVGGLETAKQEILNIIQLPLQYSSLFASIKQSIGILLYGPPGTGKTLLAKAIATEFKMNFVSIKGPELLNPYVGQSEENIRNVFSKAVQSRPCILFFDEIDALVPSRGNASDGGNVMDRVVSQLLTEIDSISNAFNGEIFIIAATNRPDLLDASLLRPKRLDKQIYLGISEREDEKLKIIEALTRKFKFAENEKMKKMDILRVVAGDKRLDRFTGADLYALCCDAMMCCLKTLIEEIQNMAEQGGDKLSVDLVMELIENGKRGELEGKYGVNINDEQWNRISGFETMLELTHFESALENIRPSLTSKEIEQYRSIHRSPNL